MCGVFKDVFLHNWFYLKIKYLTESSKGESTDFPHSSTQHVNNVIMSSGALEEICPV